MEADSMEVQMEQAVGSPGSLDAFLQTGRTGRRNAVPDILTENATVSTADLPCSLEKLSCSDDGSSSSGDGQLQDGQSSSADVSQASSSQT